MNVTLAPSSSSTSSSSSDDAHGVNLPTVILWEYIAPFIRDRKTWNALVSVNKEMYQQSQATTTTTTTWSHPGVRTPPWPQIRWRLLAGRARSVAFGHDFLACGTERGKIQLWNNRNGKTLVLGYEYHQRHDVPFIMAIGNSLLSCSAKGILMIWQNQDWTKSHTFSVVKNSTRSANSYCAWLDEPDVVRFVAAIEDRTISTFRIVFDHNEAGAIELIKDKEIQTCHRGQIHVIGKIGHYLVSGGSDERLLAWDIRTLQEGGEVQPYQMPLPSAGKISSLQVCKTVLAVACGKNIVLYNSSLQVFKVIKGYNGNIRCVTFSLDGMLLASAYNDGTIWLWNVDDGVCIEKWHGHCGFLVCALDFQGVTLVSVGSDGTVAIWDISRVKSWARDRFPQQAIKESPLDTCSLGTIDKNQNNTIWKLVR